MLNGSLTAAIISITMAQAPETDSRPEAATPERLRTDLTQLRTESADMATLAGRVAADWGLRVLGVVLILIGAWIVGAWARKTVYRALNRPKFDQTLVRFLSNAVRWAVLILGLVAALTIFGIAPASLAAVVGATGLAIGLALQGSLSNLAAGILLLLLRPFKVGDVIIVAGQTGRVDDIELFNTQIDSFDNRRIIVPNGQIFGAVIENVTHHPRRRVEITVGVDYAADIDATRQALLRAAAAVPGVLADPKPDASLSALNSSSVDWQVFLWCNTSDLGIVRQTAIRAIKIALEEAGIGIPFPQMEVWSRGRSAGPRPRDEQDHSRLNSLSPDWPRLAGAAPDPE
jgi:small conductance mechanosensitive channel